MPHSFPLALNTPLNPFIPLPTVSLTTYNFIFQYPTHSFLSPPFQPFIPIFHSCTQESRSHHHTHVHTTHLFLHNLICIPNSFISVIPHVCMKLHACMGAMQTWPPIIPIFLSQPMAMFHTHPIHMVASI